jgi:hypothetical protein
VKPSEQSVDRLLRDLHWLPVNIKRIIYKTAFIVHKVLRVHQPSYLSPQLTPYTPSLSLRSSGQGLLKEPKARLEIGTRCFSLSAPRIWNSLPLTIRTAETTSLLKKRLEIHLFMAVV